MDSDVITGKLLGVCHTVFVGGELGLLFTKVKISQNKVLLAPSLLYLRLNKHYGSKRVTFRGLNGKLVTECFSLFFFAFYIKVGGLMVMLFCLFTEISHVD